MDSLTAKVVALPPGSPSETRNADSSTPQRSKTCRWKVARLDNASRIPEPRSPATETKSARDYHISPADSPSQTEITALKNRCVSKYLRGNSTLIKTLSEINNDDFRIIMKLASYQGNNEAYFTQLQSFALPDGHHSRGYEETLETFRAKGAEMVSDNYRLCCDVLLAEASNGDRLFDDFGIYFTPSSVWLNPVAEKLSSLNCKKGIEVFAGKGYLSYFLTHYGFEMLASDNQQSCYSSAPSAPVRVRTEDSINTVNKFKSMADFLVICWPPSWDNSHSFGGATFWPPDYEILQAWGKSKPILYVGERQNKINSTAHESMYKCILRIMNKEGNHLRMRCTTGSTLFHNHLTMYFDACPIEQYRGRRVDSLDEAIIYTPNSREVLALKDSLCDMLPTPSLGGPTAKRLGRNW